MHPTQAASSPMNDLPKYEKKLVQNNMKGNIKTDHPEEKSKKKARLIIAHLSKFYQKLCFSLGVATSRKKCHNALFFVGYFKG